MSCGCASRMRKILKVAGYRLEGSVWLKEGATPIPDARIEEDHFRVLIESMSEQLFGKRAASFMRITGG